ncbi:hypothetical protein FE257_005611 [Aspergillus nanangensis]|uniref:Uncharacterized protein n=1 Tax=Aspergillus nanangensis TaxID=2582783 RepID=A0AAD4CQC0_ASPNN|nr:hypothetical protein FE257_005611 [Aspergillus nanangensis]
MKNVQTPLTNFKFFGNVWLEEPSYFLDQDGYDILRRYMPLIRALDNEWQHRSKPIWDLQSRFVQFVHEETQAWRQRCSERPAQFLLYPSGSIAAPLAHHLLNPTFHVIDPYSRETDDSSSPTIYLLQENGFSSRNSFMFDQICRREDTHIYLHLWTEDVQKPHDDFVRDLRHHMSAIVEICWGEVAWRKVEQQVELIRFPLWGKYKDVRLYLELEENGSELKRFVFWVLNVQDTALGLAASMVDMSIEGNLYEQFPRHKYPRLTKQQREVRNGLMESVKQELRAAFPVKAHEEEERRSRMDSKRKEKSQQIQTILRDLENSQKIETHKSPLKTGMENDDSELWRIQRQKIQDQAKSWLAVSQRISNKSLPLDPLAKERLGNLENPAVADSDWFDLPMELIAWLQNQDGLKIGGDQISCREGIEKVFRLLGFGEQTLHTGSIKTSPIGEIAAMVGWGENVLPVDRECLTMHFLSSQEKNGRFTS